MENKPSITLIKKLSYCAYIYLAGCILGGSFNAFAWDLPERLAVFSCLIIYLIVTTVSNFLKQP